MLILFTSDAVTTKAREAADAVATKTYSDFDNAEAHFCIAER